MNIKKIFIFAAVLCAALCVFADAKIIWENGRGDHNIKIKKKDQVLQIETVGGDPYAFFRVSAAKPADEILEFEYISEGGVNNIQIFPGTPFKPDYAITLGGLPPAEKWLKKSFNLSELSDGLWLKQPRKMLRIDFGAGAGFALQVRNMVLRSPTKEELAAKSAAKPAADSAPKPAGDSGGAKQN